MLFRLIQLAIGLEFEFDFVVAGKRLGGRSAELTRRLAFGQRKIVDTVFRHQACSMRGNALAHQMGFGFAGGGFGHGSRGGRRSYPQWRDGAGRWARIPRFIASLRGFNWQCTSISSVSAALSWAG